MSAIKLSFFLIGIELGEIPVGAHLLFFLVSYLESLLIPGVTACAIQIPACLVAIVNIPTTYAHIDPKGVAMGAATRGGAGKGDLTIS